MSLRRLPRLQMPRQPRESLACAPAARCEMARVRMRTVKASAEQTAVQSRHCHKVHPGLLRNIQRRFFLCFVHTRYRGAQLICMLTIDTQRHRARVVACA